jgi:hypothetical protein
VYALNVPEFTKLLAMSNVPLPPFNVPEFVSVNVDVTVAAATSNCEPDGIDHAGEIVKPPHVPPKVNPSVPLKVNPFEIVATGVPMLAEIVVVAFPVFKETRL